MADFYSFLTWIHHHLHPALPNLNEDLLIYHPAHHKLLIAHRNSDAVYQELIGYFSYLLSFLGSRRRLSSSIFQLDGQKFTSLILLFMMLIGVLIDN